MTRHNLLPKTAAIFLSFAIGGLLQIQGSDPPAQEAGAFLSGVPHEEPTASLGISTLPLPTNQTDPAFDVFIDLRSVVYALSTSDLQLLIDLGLQLGQGEQVLMRTHRSGITARALLAKAARLAADKQDNLSLRRLAKAAEQYNDRDLIAHVQAMAKLSSASRAVDPAFLLSVENIDLEAVAKVKRILADVRYATAVGDPALLETLERETKSKGSMPADQTVTLSKMIAEARAELTQPVGTEEANLRKLMSASRDYETNKFDRKAKVEKGGWVVAWAKDISETDAIEGVVAGGVSIYSANPAPFIAWVETLVERTISSLMASAKEEFPNAIRRQAMDLAMEAIKAAIQGQDAREVFRQYDTVDFKAGAIKYSGRNYQNVWNPFKWKHEKIYYGPPTWGIKPYVAFRWRGSGGSGTGNSERTQAIYVRNKAPFPVSVAVHYKLNNHWRTDGFRQIDPGQRSLVCRTDNTWIYFYANGPGYKWDGTDSYQVVAGKQYGFFQKTTGEGWEDWTLELNYTPPAQSARRWAYVDNSGRRGYFEQVEGNLWIEVQANGTRIKFQEVARTSAYVELYDSGRGQVWVRLYADHSTWKHPSQTRGEWRPLWKGAYDHSTRVSAR